MCNQNTGKTRGYLLCGASVTDTHANGMSVVYHLQDGSFVIFDGGNSSVGEHLYNTLRELNGEGDIRVAAWIITHPHGDHFGGMCTMLNKGCPDVKVKEIWYNDINNWGAPLLKLWAEKLPDTPVRSFVLGDKVSVGEIDMQVISTPEAVIAYDENAFNVTDGSNNADVVYMLTIGGKKILMSGDAGPVAWGFMMTNLDKYPIKCDYLQIPHHGVHNSGTDEAYAEIDPKHIVIPAGLVLAKRFTLETNKNVSAQSSYRLYKRMGVDMTYETETDGKTYWFAGVYGNENSEYVKKFFEI